MKIIQIWPLIFNSKFSFTKTLELSYADIIIPSNYKMVQYFSCRIILFFSSNNELDLEK